MRGSVRRRRNRGALTGGCGCGCGGAGGCAPVLVPGGGDSCPSWLQPLSGALAKNRGAVDVIVSFCQSISVGLTASIMGAPLAAPVVAVGAVLSALSSGCDAGQALQQQARAASVGAKTMGIAAAIGSVLALVGIVSAPLTPVLGIIAAVSAALVPVFDALGAGRAPKGSDVTNAVSGMLKLANIDVPMVRQVGDFLDGALRSITDNPALKGPAKELAKLAKSAPKVTAADSNAANHRAMRDLVQMTLTTSDKSRWVVDTTGTSGKFALERAKYLKRWIAAGSPTSVDARRSLWRGVALAEAAAPDLLSGAREPDEVLMTTSSRAPMTDAKKAAIEAAKAKAKASIREKALQNRRVTGLSTPAKVGLGLGAVAIVGGVVMASRRRGRR